MARARPGHCQMASTRPNCTGILNAKQDRKNRHHRESSGTVRKYVDHRGEAAIVPAANHG